MVDDVRFDEVPDGGSEGRDKTAAAGERLARVLSPEAIDALVVDAQDAGIGLDGAEGLLGGLTRTVLECVLQAEMTEHLGYEAGDPAGHGTGNSHNGTYPKTVITQAGRVTVAVPGDRAGSFEPGIVKSADGAWPGSTR